MLKLFYKVIIIISITLIAYFYSNAQSLQLVSVDASKYPTITMDFFAKDAKGNDVHNFNAGDITITDMPCTNIIPSLVYCPPATQSKYSLIITLDYSGSMFNDLLKNGRPKYTAVVQAAKAIIAALPSDRTRWECAVTAFSSCCKLVQDFTTDSLKLVQAIDNVYKFQGGQTDYNAGFLYCCHQSNPGYGSLRIANNAKNKPIVIFLTDGDQDYQTACSGEPSRSSVWTGQISQEAANLKIPATIFSIIVGVSTGAVPASRIALQNISTGTPHGEYFETNSVNAQDITDIFLDLLSKSDTIGSSAPCRVSWDACCKGGQKVTMAIKSLGVSQDTSYTVNDSTRWKECDSCKNIPFDYINFNNPDNIILNGNAFKFDSVIRLTDNRLNMSGSAFIKYLIPIDMGFSSSFSFRFSQGSNLSCDDGSLPGADGFAFVIQNSGSTAIGWFGGSIGYEGISNSLAVEFDTYSNDSTQIENYFDPNGNHIAVQSLGSKPNTSKHKPEALLGINKNILVMKPDGTIYYSTIEYDAVYHQLNIFHRDFSFLYEVV